MARKKAERREPTFDLDDNRGSDGFRLTADDRPTIVNAPRAKRARAPETEWDTDDGEPPRKERPQRRRSKGRDKPPKQGRSFFGFIFYWCFVLGIWATLAAIGIVGWYAAHLPPISELKVPDRPPNIAIIGTSGDILVNRGAMGQAVAIGSLPKHLPRAVVAVEDRRFYSHMGVDPIGLSRALFKNLLRRGVSEGGSTLTQQLAKNLFLTHERTMGRKIQELVLALWLEARFTKDEILEMYLNRVYLGAGTYGVDAAAHRYFDKPASKLTLQESAVIAGLLKAPSRYAPSRNPRAAEARARTVLQTMVESGFISENDARLAGGQTLKVVAGDAAGSSINYAADWVMDILPSLIGTVRSDIIVETTIDPTLQREAENALREALDKEGAKLQVTQGAIVAMDITGAVKALIGGRSYAESQYNRAIVAKRQPGSSFKPFVFLTALERGLSPATLRDDSPINIKGWNPENYTRDYRGATSLRDALALSLNTIAVRLALEVTPKEVVKTATRLGITSTMQPNPSIALGTSETTLLEMTRAYVPFANGGEGVMPYVIRSIRSSDGQVLFKRSGDGPGRVVRGEHVAQMNNMLAHAVAAGTARKAHIPNWAVAGKTGTSQDFRDAWFIGYTAHLVGGVWLGNDDGTSTKKLTGGGLPTQIWSKFMAAAHRNVPPIALPGAGEALPAPDPGAPSIDDILLGRFTLDAPQGRKGASTSAGRASGTDTQTDGRSPSQPVDVGDCPLDANFMRCVFGR